VHAALQAALERIARTAILEGENTKVRPSYPDFARHKTTRRLVSHDIWMDGKRFGG
jgi:hypothetical protein